nr:hypothetical protein [uncultured Psychroserpens sp.]
MTRKEQIDKNGYILIKNVFSPEEVDKMREMAIAEDGLQGDLLSSEKLASVMMDERVLNIFKECLNSDKLYYFADSNLSINRAGKGGFHKDSTNRHKKDSKEFTDIDYSLLRMGIYLQDHANSSRGLCLREGSHLHQSCGIGKIINVKSEIGDVVIWKLSTTHSANAQVISMFPNTSFHPLIARFVPDFLKQEAANPRVVLFMCFGLKDDYAIEYREYLKTRQYAVDRWQHSNYSDEVVAKMNALGVEIYDGFNIDEIDQDKVNVLYKQI